MHPYVHCSIIHGGQDMETSKVPFNRELDKDVAIYTTGYYSAIRKDKILQFVTTWMDSENIMLSEIKSVSKPRTI